MFDRPRFVFERPGRPGERIEMQLRPRPDRHRRGLLIAQRRTAFLGEGYGASRRGCRLPLGDVFPLQEAGTWRDQVAVVHPQQPRDLLARVHLEGDGVKEIDFEAGEFLLLQGFPLESGEIHRDTGLEDVGHLVPGKVAGHHGKKLIHVPPPGLAHRSYNPAGGCAHNGSPLGRGFRRVRHDRVPASAGHPPEAAPRARGRSPR